jgi:hypothetical protein
VFDISLKYSGDRIKILLINSVEDCIYTMACVEAAYESDKNGSIKMSK